MSQFASATDPYNLGRFVAAQQSVIDTVLAELRNGRKLTHWMWFIFPQLRGLGTSSNANYYGISSLEEARSYLQHTTLGPRLRECTLLTNCVQNLTFQQIFGGIDSIKFHSCMTLFSQADSTQACFIEALNKYFAGRGDPLTLEMLLKTG